uniref:Uncharacterized protein n=1 Tax=Picea sitchensis TaxID=3332 RepID=A0A6B9XV79_PICSI|nr:hypothetical protein Q903MT_gene4254 [Picea sitchensis]
MKGLQLPFNSFWGLIYVKVLDGRWGLGLLQTQECTREERPLSHPPQKLDPPNQNS